MTLRVGEYGVVLRLGTSYDVSSQTELTLDFTAPSGATKTKATADGVAVETGSVSTTQGTFAANESVKYTLADGDIDEAGSWSVQLTYEDATKKLISDAVPFTVVS